MAYQRLGKIPTKDLIAALQARNPKLLTELEPFIQPDDGGIRFKGPLGHALAKTLDDWLDADHYQQMNVTLTRQMTEQGKRDAAKNAALQRLEQWAREQNLAREQSNVDKISEWIDTNARGIWSAVTVDGAIQNLRVEGRLKFEQPPVTPPPPAPERQWKRGDRLPDNATEEQLRASTPEEIRAWMRRTRP